MANKIASIVLLLIAEVLVLALWFSSAAVLPDMIREVPVSSLRQAMLTSSVQAGFAVGAILYAVFGVADRFDPRRVFLLSAAGAGLFNAALLVVPIGGDGAIAARFLSGALLAGVYPVGMKIAVGWGQKDRGLLVGLLVGALTLGSAAPHLLSFLGGADWRAVVIGSTAMAFAGSILVQFCGLGPFHARAAAFRLSSLKRAWTDRRIRAAYGGYLGHMWELYALWAWVGIALVASFELRADAAEALSAAKLTAFGVIAIGGVSSILAGYFADRIGKAEVAILCMAGSGLSAIAAAMVFGGPIWLVGCIFVLWGIFVVADSAQFSALVADFAPPEEAGALLTLQTSLGFALTVFTVQAVPLAVASIGWPGLFAILAIGPALGIWSMWTLRR